VASGNRKWAHGQEVEGGGWRKERRKGRGEGDRYKKQEKGMRKWERRGKREEVERVGRRKRKGWNCYHLRIFLGIECTLMIRTRG
jgi:hypothetical protein